MNSHLLLNWRRCAKHSSYRLRRVLLVFVKNQTEKSNKFLMIYFFFYWFVVHCFYSVFSLGYAHKIKPYTIMAI